LNRHVIRHTEPFRIAATEIAEELAAAAERDELGVSWRTAAYDVRTEQFAWLANPSIYDGTAGIALFMLEAGEILGEPRYRQLALDALRWCAATSEKRPQPFLFYGGPLGLVYALARAHALTGDGEFLELARRTAPSERARLPAMAGDLVSGTAGTILGLLHLHAAIGEAWIIEMLDRLLADLAERGRWTPEGVTWSADKENIRGLCGMAHGNSGVAFVLLEASHYLGRPELLRLALEAQRYEAAFFNAEDESWPDFRRAGRMPDDIFELRYGHSGDDFFRKVTVMDAWCHGAPGIGLARLRAFELLGGEPWRTDAIHAIARTSHADPSGFTLCHGHCGNAMTFIEAARVFHDPRYLAMAEAVGERAIASKKERGFYDSGFHMLKNGFDTSLLMGNAGIGYFYLQLIAPELRSPLLPRVETRLPVAMRNGLTEGGIARRLIAASMPGTMQTVEQHASDQFFTTWRTRDEALNFLRGAAGDRLQLSLETAKLNMLDNWPSLALTRYQQWCAQKDSAQWRSAADLSLVRLRLAPYVQIWRDEESGSVFLLQLRDYRIAEQPLTPLAETVLTSFETARSLNEVCESLIDSVPAAPDLLRNAVERQVLAAVTAGFLVRGE